MMRSKILIVLTWCCISFLSSAQDLCKDAIFKADKLYQEGKIKELIALLEPCYHKELNKEEKLEASRFLALAYSEENNEGKTDYYLKQLLSLNPSYQEFPMLDPIPFKKKVESYLVKPKWYGGLYAGPSIAYPKITNSFSAFDVNQYYQASMGWNSKLFLNHPMNKNLSYSVQLGYSRIPVIHKMDIENMKELQATELIKQIALETDVYYSTTLVKNIILSGGVGAGLGYITSSMRIIEMNHKESGEIRINSKISTYEMNQVQPYLYILGKIEYGIGKGFIGFAPSWQFYLRNTAKESERLNDVAFIFNTGYVLDNVIIRQIQLGLSYRHPLAYSVTKKKI